MYLKNGLAEKEEGKKRKGKKRKGKRQEGRKKKREKFGAQWERQENEEEHILKPMLIYFSS